MTRSSSCKSSEYSSRKRKHKHKDSQKEDKKGKKKKSHKKKHKKKTRKRQRSKSPEETRRNEPYQQNHAPSPTRSTRMAPMTKEQYEQQNAKIRQVYDEDTGRVRLVRGSGEIIERIVSKQEHTAIQAHATRFGWDYEKILNQKHT